MVEGDLDIGIDIDVDIDMDSDMEASVNWESFEKRVWAPYRACGVPLSQA